MKKTTKILFICLGNICRSPLAEAIFRQIVEKKDLEKFFEINSAGTANYHVGGSADSRSIAVAKANGITLKHTVKRLKSSDFDYYDFILGMDFDNIVNAKKFCKSHHNLSKLKTIGSIDNENPQQIVKDPYYEDLAAFNQIYEQLNNLSLMWLNHIVLKS